MKHERVLTDSYFLHTGCARFREMVAQNGRVGGKLCARRGSGLREGLLAVGAAAEINVRSQLQDSWP